MADRCKREGRTTKAKKYWRLASKELPQNPQVWSEWSKLEEEAGNFSKAKRIVEHGLDANPSAETLAVRGIKLAERSGDHRGVRNILGQVRQWQLDKSWKVLSEVC